MGDPSGIGPEVLAAALHRREVTRALDALVFGDASLAGRLPGRAQLRVVSALAGRDRKPGRPVARGGVAQLAYVTALVEAARGGEVDALCTGPVSKAGICATGVPFVGHTELLAESFGCEVLMLMKGPRLSVALATNHLPIARVPQALIKARLVAQLQLLSRTLTPRIGHSPRIAVCGLNPHAGDGGTLGTEEQRVIGPAVARARELGVRCEGPFAADGLFAKAAAFPYDVALAMYHDQGLVAAKCLDFAATVNVTLGLPLPRTSVDHGVAYDIAGKGLADDRPMVHALLEAARFAKPAR